MWQSNIYDKKFSKKIKAVHFVIWDQDYFVFVITSFSRLFQQRLGEICYFSYFFPSNQSTIQCNVYYPRFIGKTSQELTIFLTQIQNYAVIHQRKNAFWLMQKTFGKYKYIFLASEFVYLYSLRSYLLTKYLYSNCLAVV